MEKLNEDCGCGGSSESIRGFEHNRNESKYSSDPLVGKKVSLNDGRTGSVDDTIRNSLGEVIGYVIEGDEGTYRVFKNKISGILNESSGAFASLDSVQGMGDAIPPSSTRTGSGDQFPSLSVGTSSAKGSSKKTKKESPLKTSLLDFKSFIKKSKENQ